ncbi:LysR family transcriptional regulator [Rhodococcus sp. 06-156-3C]|uniref:LysR family transcriptional regulator n=1 Tax=Nocardiaceae TaxID=85025 RepID=UPI0005230369|nr:MULTISPECIES: LysR family transcriptional regulator [Rhodococcus]OZD08792.1 LysR family transcriptional regulator [Rhodococcus sp. 06-156-4C]OZD17384.1 LysR family transcriptional regulator [Rhodococcus sp. 06-156-3C]OZD18722.1 LysR family transcriptional regulator [Rhodococcus sp. 06-156-4a]OZD25113.1 LysR family transcriptional regulator [Rhodococcus sp. 06-156-3b]OZD34272.1 LysR family transcriptional regulator [Rhodococcus sp. 06-156-3]
MVEIRQARYFIAVAEELHFGRAASRLHMSQPPLSQAIQQIERDTSVKLLNRSSRSVSLTQAGSVFLEHCRTLVKQAQLAETAALQAQNGYLGQVSIGAVSSAFENLLPNAIAVYRRTRPDVEMFFREVDTHVGARAVLQHDVDIAIVRQATAPSGCRVVPLRQDHFVAAVPSTHPLASTVGSIELAWLAKEAWIWLPREISPGYHDEMAAACREAGLTPDTRHRANSINSQIAMVECGLGVTIVPHSSASTPSDRVSFLELVTRAPLTDLSIISRIDTEPSIDHFVDCATRVAAIA